MTISDESSVPVRIDLFTDGLNEDPYSFYEALRSLDPIHWDPILRVWVLTRQDDIRQVLGDDSFEVLELSKSIEAFARKSGKDLGSLAKAAEAVTFFQNGEKHRLSRRSMSRAMTRIPLSRLEPVLDDLAGELVAGLSAREKFDAVRDYAVPFPSMVMAHILGLPPSDTGFLFEVGHDIILSFDVMSLANYVKLNQKVETALDHLSGRISEAVFAGSDVELVRFYEDAPYEGNAKLLEASAQVFVAYFVGMLTTSALIANTIDAVIKRPDLYSRARRDGNLVRPIVEEVMRLEAPVQRTLRIATEDTVVGGRRIRRGERLVLLLGAGNRDPSAFPEPDRLDPARTEVSDTTFGGGKHMCVGVTLARLEARIALARFLELPPVVRSTDPRRWQAGVTVRRLTDLPVRFSD